MTYLVNLWTIASGKGLADDESPHELFFNPLVAHLCNRWNKWRRANEPAMGSCRALRVVEVAFVRQPSRPYGAQLPEPVSACGRRGLVQ